MIESMGVAWAWSTLSAYPNGSLGQIKGPGPSSDNRGWTCIVATVIIY